MTLQLPTLDNSILAAEATYADSVVTTRLRGTADVESRSLLDQHIDALHDEACRLGVTKVAVDLRELEFMNSSSFKVFVGWLAKVQDLEPDKQYRIHFMSTPGIHWQRRSLQALSCFASALVTVET